MKKTIAMLLLTALCMTVLTSCDLGNGLISELLGDIKDVTIGEQNYPTNDYIAIETDIVMDTMPPVVEIETTPPYEIMTEDYTIDEYWTEDVSVDIEPDATHTDIATDDSVQDEIIPTPVQVGYTAIGLMYNGKIEELMDAQDLLDWNGTLELEYQPGARIYIKGFVAYDRSDNVLYHSNIPGSETGQSYDFSSSDYYELYGDWLDCDYMHGIYFTIPMNSLEIGYNVAELYAQSVKSPLDDWIMLASVDIAIAGETDFTDEVETPVG